MSGKNQALEIMKAMAAISEGFQEVAPMMAEIIEGMRQAVSGENHAGYFRAMNKILEASDEEKEMLLLLLSWWVARVKVAAAQDPLFYGMLQPVFDDSKILGKI